MLAFIRAKVKNSVKTSTFIVIHVTGCHWKSKVSDDCSSLPDASPMRPGSRSSPLCLFKCSSADVTCMCRAPPSAVVPLSSGPIQHQCLLPVNGVVFSHTCSTTAPHARSARWIRPTKLMINCLHKGMNT